MKGGVEVSAGVVIIVVGVVVQLWSRQLAWIAVYPPPLGKQILDVLPYVLWVLGAALVADGIRRLLAPKTSISLMLIRYLVLGVVITLCSLIYSEELPWPDFYHINYGFPFTWLTRTLNTIAGPVDYFQVNHAMLAANIIFWSTVTLAVSQAWGRIKAKKLTKSLSK